MWPQCGSRKPSLAQQKPERPRRPSAVPKGAAALPHRPDGRVQASPEEAVEAVMRQLGTSERHLQVR